MECGVLRSEVEERRSPAKTGLHVNFIEKGEVKERREKFLTAKYGSHQMSLIRKRLAVEMWLYDELQKLYESSNTVSTIYSFLSVYKPYAQSFSLLCVCCIITVSRTKMKLEHGMTVPEVLKLCIGRIFTVKNTHNYYNQLHIWFGLHDKL